MQDGDGTERLYTELDNGLSDLLSPSYPSIYAQFPS